MDYQRVSNTYKNTVGLTVSHKQLQR